VPLQLCCPAQQAPKHTFDVEGSNLTNNVSPTRKHLQAYLDAHHRALESLVSAELTRRPMLTQGRTERHQKLRWKHSKLLT
jgi:hypothetical protein